MSQFNNNQRAYYPLNETTYFKVNKYFRQITKNKLKLYVESYLNSLLKTNCNNIDVIEGQNSGDSYMKELEKELEKRIK